MMDTAKIRALAEERLAGSDLFVVDVTCSPANEVEVLVDSDSSVAIEDCVELSRAIEASLDRDVEDFALTVSSAGIGQPLRMLRQYRRLIGRPVEVVLHTAWWLVTSSWEVMLYDMDGIFNVLFSSCKHYFSC